VAVGAKRKHSLSNAITYKVNGKIEKSKLKSDGEFDEVTDIGVVKK
jgi:hypothetical protein